MHKTFYRELDLNIDPIGARDIYAAKKQEAEGQELVDIINANPGVMWMTPEQVDLQTIIVCCEEIIAREEKGTLPLKLAKQILKLIKTPRNVARKPVRRRR